MDVNIITQMGDAWVAMLAPVIVAVVEAIKKAAPFISRKYIPLVSILLGILCGIFFVSAAVPVKVLMGLLIGTSASGIKSGVKAAKK